MLNADNSGAASPIFYDLPGLVPVNLSMDGYNVGRLLWSKTTGDNLIQNLLPDNSTSTLTAMTAGHLANTGASMGYDGDGLRAWKQNDAGTRTYFLYDGSDPVCEMDASGNISAVNTFGATGLLSRHTTATNASVFYTFDERGNVAQRTDAGANVLSSDLYDGYGKKMAGPSDVWGFGAQAGYYTDAETGLVLCTHRFYDPQTGRFITRDPMGYGGGVNLYGYVTNNPTNRTDPDGYIGPVWAVAGGGTLTFGGGALLGGGGLAGIGETLALLTPPGVIIAAGAVLAYAGNKYGNALADATPGQDGLPATISQVRGGKKLKPDPNATGGHCTWRRGSDGGINHGATWEPNPQNPKTGWDDGGRYDRDGDAHTNKDGTIVPTPHTHDADGEATPYP